MSKSDYIEHVARISYGKDSLKMLEVIHSRGLPLDRITTTDVWATDTISANLPPLDAFKERMDQRIWDMYRIEVEHLCAMNPDGSKRTYEQMFYHVPVRRSQNVQVEREREFRTERFKDSRGLAGRGVKESSSADTWGLGFPVHGTPWCQDLKHSWVTDIRLPSADIPLVQKAQDRLCQNPFLGERPTRRKDIKIVEYIGIAADEPKRFKQLNEKKRAPLVEYGIEEELCGLYCRYSDMLSPTYGQCWKIRHRFLRIGASR